MTFVCPEDGKSELCDTLAIIFALPLSTCRKMVSKLCDGGPGKRGPNSTSFVSFWTENTSKLDYQYRCVL